MFENWPNDLIYNTANCFLDNAFSPTQKVSLAVLHSFCLLLGQFQPELACKSVTIKKVYTCAYQRVRNVRFYGKFYVCFVSMIPFTAFKSR